MLTIELLVVEFEISGQDGQQKFLMKKGGDSILERAREEPSLKQRSRLKLHGKRIRIPHSLSQTAQFVC